MSFKRAALRRQSRQQLATAALLWATLLIVSGALLIIVKRAETANLPVNNVTLDKWLVSDLQGVNTYKPMMINNYSVVPHDEVSHWPVNTYYWQAPEPYYQWKIYTYGGDLKFLVNHIVTRGDTSGKYLDEPDLVLEGGSKEHHYKIGYRLPTEDDMRRGYDKNQTIRMPLTEKDWVYLVESEGPNGVKQLKLSDRAVSRADFSLVLAGLDRSLIRAKYHMDQVEGDLYDVNMHITGNKSRTVECDNDCSGLLLDDLDNIGLMFDEIMRLLPRLNDPPGPWRRLKYLSGRADNLTEALSHYLRLIALAKEVIDISEQGLNQETLADMLELRASNLDARAPSIALEAYQARLLAQRTLDELLKSLWDKINDAIKLLNERGFGPSGVSPGQIEQIVRESERILRELRNRNLKPHLEEAERELRKAKILLDKIRTLLIDPEKSAELLKRLEQLNKVLVDFSRIVKDQVLKPTGRANELVAEGKKKYAAILALIKEAEERSKESQSLLDEAKRMLEITKKCLADEAAYLDALPRQLTELKNNLHEIEVKRSILTSVNPDYKRKYVDKCRDHGDALMRKAQELDGLFNQTRDVADYALRAANAYKNIVDAIDGAEKAAKRAYDAAEKAYKVAVPDFDKSLADRAREAKLKSMELLERARKLRDQDVARLSLELAKRKQIIDQMFEDVRGLIDELDQINAGLKQLADKNFLEQLQAIDDLLKRLLERLAEIHKRLQTLSDLIYTSLLPQYERLSAGSQSSLGNLSQVIDTARKDLMSAIKYAANSKMSLEKILKLEAKLDIDLDMLRRKIQLAHQEATSVHVSIMADSTSGVCTRSYMLPSVLSAAEGGISVGGFNIKQISLVWSLHSEESESLLLFIGSKTNEDFIAIEMHNGSIRLVFNLASYSTAGTQVLTHPRVITQNDKGLLSDEAWYLITVNVVNELYEDRLMLNVRPVLKPADSERPVTHRMSLRAGAVTPRLDVSPYGEADMHFYVGGLPPAAEYTAPSEVKSTRLTGCLYNMALNDQQVGLWNFKTNMGCEGCMEGPMEAKDTSSYSFTGSQSYATALQNRPYDQTKYMVSMSVRTTDSDALLFLALGETSNHYLAVSMQKGRVALLVGKLSATHHNYLSLSSSASLFDYTMSAHLHQQIRSSSSSSGSNPNDMSATSTSSTNNTTAAEKPVEHLIVTSKEYNSGQWVRISIEKDQNKIMLAVDQEYRESVADDKLLSLDLDLVFFGGVWPIIKPSKFAGTQLEFGSMAGCMKDVQIETTAVDLLRRQSYGVEAGCSALRSRSLARVLRLQYPLPAGR